MRFAIPFLLLLLLVSGPVDAQRASSKGTAGFPKAADQTNAPEFRGFLLGENCTAQLPNFERLRKEGFRLMGENDFKPDPQDLCSAKFPSDTASYRTRTIAHFVFGSTGSRDGAMEKHVITMYFDDEWSLYRLTSNSYYTTHPETVYLEPKAVVDRLIEKYRADHARNAMGAKSDQRLHETTYAILWVFEGGKTKPSALPEFDSADALKAVANSIVGDSLFVELRFDGRGVRAIESSLNRTKRQQARQPKIPI